VGHLSLGGHLDAARLSVYLAAVDLLARLGDGLEHRLVAEARGGDDGGRLLLERDFVGLDACLGLSDTVLLMLLCCDYHEVPVVMESRRQVKERVMGRG